MTNTLTTTATQNTQDFLKTAALIQTVAYYQKKIEKSRRQLLTIERANEGNAKGAEAEDYLKKQNKLAEIATELLGRMIAQIASKTITPEMEEQFTQEVEILNWMHFEVTKTYFSFINQNFEAKVISLRRPMAA